jgi:hypothetical protein
MDQYYQQDFVLESLHGILPYMHEAFVVQPIHIQVLIVFLFHNIYIPEDRALV